MSGVVKVANWKGGVGPTRTFEARYGPASGASRSLCLAIESLTLNATDFRRVVPLLGEDLVHYSFASLDLLLLG